VVALLRRRLGERRIGHSGTLDPGATGVLLVGVGSLTRALRFLTDLPKTYTGEVVLGVETNTLDDSGDVMAVHDMVGVMPEDVRIAVADHLTGPIQQVPPMVSALKVGGRRLHELAREGVEVERQPRPVVVHRFDVESTDEPLVYRIEVECSSGTYIRSLAADLGRLLGGGAYLRRLRRTAIGSFTEADAAPPDQAVLLPSAEALRDYTRVEVDATTAGLVAHGRVLPSFDGPAPWALVGPDGDLLAVYEPHGPGGASAKPSVVLVPNG
jgi:tRNA pseudouridine55 synthase